MAAPTARSPSDRMRDLGDFLFVLAERHDASERDLAARQGVHDDLERTAGEIRALVRGRTVKLVNPPLEVSKDGSRCVW